MSDGIAKYEMKKTHQLCNTVLYSCNFLRKQKLRWFPIKGNQFTAINATDIEGTVTDFHQFKLIFQSCSVTLDFFSQNLMPPFQLMLVSESTSASVVKKC